MEGGGGIDFIMGRNGNDRLTGGAGADIFVISDYTAGDIDTITDFTVGEDVIVIDVADNAYRFHATDNSRFHIGSGPTTPDQRYVYNAETGPSVTGSKDLTWLKTLLLRSCRPGWTSRRRIFSSCDRRSAVMRKRRLRPPFFVAQ